MKRILPLILCLLMILGAAPLSAFAVETASAEVGAQVEEIADTGAEFEIADTGAESEVAKTGWKLLTEGQ